MFLLGGLETCREGGRKRNKGCYEVNYGTKVEAANHCVGSRHTVLFGQLITEVSSQIEKENMYGVRACSESEQICFVPQTPETF